MASVNNSVAATQVYNQMNRNNTQLSKDLKKVASGMKINSAGDDASAYSISEKMQVRIRGLSQCDDNTKTGKSMLTIAERAVNEQIEIARNLKEMAINSANDTNTDEDRAIIQKEANHLLLQMNAISYETTYNGKQLLTGRELGGTTTYFDPGAPPKANNPNVNIFQAPNGGNSYWSTGSIPGYVPGGTTNPSYTYSFSLSGVSGNLPNALDGQGFSILCGACGQFNSVMFDANKPGGAVDYYPPSGTSQADAYIIGIQGLNFASDIEDAIFDALCTANNVPQPATSVRIGNHNTTMVKTSSGYELTRDVGYPASYDSNGNKISEGSYLVLYNGFKGDMVTEHSYSPWGNFYIQGDTKASQETLLQLPNTTLDVLFPTANSNWDIDYEQSDIPTDWSSDYATLSPTEKIKKWAAEVWPYPQRGASASGSCLTTREKALKFIGDVDQALKYLLHCATNLGTQCQRMDTMNDNIVTSNENTQAAESTIRDADMAKEMTNYTKSNVLTQTAQSMLAQANQNMGSQLDLLK